MSINSIPVPVDGLHERWAWEAGEEEFGIPDVKNIECDMCGEVYCSEDPDVDMESEFPCPYCEVEKRVG